MQNAPAMGTARIYGMGMRNVAVSALRVQKAGRRSNGFSMETQKEKERLEVIKWQTLQGVIFAGEKCKRTT